MATKCAQLGTAGHGNIFPLCLTSPFCSDISHPARRDAHTTERSHWTRKHMPPHSRAPHNLRPCAGQTGPAAAMRGLPRQLGHPALTLRFPLVLCLFFPPMVEVSAAPPARSPRVDTAGPQLPAPGTGKGLTGKASPGPPLPPPTPPISRPTSAPTSCRFPDQPLRDTSHLEPRPCE